MHPQSVRAASRAAFPYVIDPDHHRPMPSDTPPELRAFYEAGFQTFDADPTGHIVGADEPLGDFAAGDWIERLAAAGGGVWFRLSLSLSPEGDLEAALPIWRELDAPADGLARRAAIARAMVLREAASIVRAAEAGREARS